LLGITLGFFLAAPRRWTLGPWTVVFLCIVVRLLPAVLFPYAAGYDLDSYELVAGAVLDGRDVYTAPELQERYPYLPGWDLIVAGIKLIAQDDVPLFTALVKVPGILADAGIALLLYRRGGAGIALAHVLSPLSAAVTAYHGQFDALPLLAVTVAAVRARPLSAGAALGLGMWIKTWPALFIVTLADRFGWRSGSRGALAALVTATTLAVAGGVATRASLGPAIEHVVGYGSTPDWGPWSIVRLLVGVSTGWKVLVLLGVLGGYALLARGSEPPRAALGLILLLLVLVPGGSIQYVSWVGPVALMAGESRWLRLWTLATLPYVAVGYFGIHYLRLIPATPLMWLLLSIPSWVVLLVWLVQIFRLRGPTRERHAELSAPLQHARSLVASVRTSGGSG
jgi:hypothetical protein